MKSKIIQGAALVYIIGTAIVTATPIQPADVVSDPVWVFHVDFDALRGTVIGQHVHSEMNKPEVVNKLAAFQAVFTIDLKNGLHGVTLYGPTSSEEDGIMVVYADFDPDRLTILAKAAHGYQSSTWRQHVIHSWIDEKRPEKGGIKPRVYGAIHGNKIVFGRKESRVAAALDVFDGISPHLSVTSDLLTTGTGGAFAHGAATKLDSITGGPNAEVLRRSKLVRFSMGEKDRQFTIVLGLEVGNEDVAKQVESICRGMIGLMALRQDQPEAQRIAQSITIERDGGRITGFLTMAADEVVHMLQARRAR